MAIPVHIITGFLGVGKTTAILHLLKELDGRERAAVLVNEWGEVPLDGAVLQAGSQGLKVLEVPGGCICCTAGAAFDQSLTQVLDELNPERIFIEPSGMAKPGEIIDLLAGHPRRGDIELRPVIGLVDPERFVNPKIMAMPLYRDQVESVSILAANRCDLVDEDKVEQFKEKALALFPPKLAVLTVSQGKLPLSVLDAAPQTDAYGRTLTGLDMAPKKQSEPHEHYAQKGWTWPSEQVFDHECLRSLMKTASQPGKDQVWAVERAKGVFHTEKGWLLMEFAMGGHHERPIQYRADSRCVFILSGEGEVGLDEIDKDLRGCLHS